MIYKVRTSVDNKDRAELIVKALVNTHAAVSAHIKEVTSIYAWEERVDTLLEYEIEALTNIPDTAYNVIKLYHNYALPEFIYEEVQCSAEINEWCTNWCKKYKKPKKS